MATYVSDSLTFDRLLSSGLPVIAKFSGKRCPPCIQNQPIFDHTAQTNSKKAHFIVIDSVEGGSLFQRYSVRSMPTFIYFHNGTEKKRVTGASTFNTDVAQFINEYGKSVFEQSKGHALGTSTDNTTSTSTASTETSASKPRQPNPNNPWANRNFNPAQRMKENEAKGKKPTEEAKEDELVFGEAGDAPEGMVCENGVCRTVDTNTADPKK